MELTHFFAQFFLMLSSSIPFLLYKKINAKATALGSLVESSHILPYFNHSNFSKKTPWPINSHQISHWKTDKIGYLNTVFTVI